MKSILIVEDESELASNISDILTNLDYEVAGIVDNGLSALEFLDFHDVDLILMDILIQGDLDGIDLSYKIREKVDLPIVFSTAYSSHEILSRISPDIHEGYLLKPFTLDSLRTAVYLGLKRHEEKILKSTKPKPSLKIMDRGYLVPVPFSEITYLQASGLYTKVFTKSKSYMIRDILKNMEEKLVAGPFIRVHKSYLVNSEYVTSFNSKKLIVSETVLPIRRGMYSILKEKLNLDEC